MNKDNGYWVRVLDEEKANILISLGYSCCSDVAIIKVADDTCREDYAYWVKDYMLKLDKSYLRSLSFVDALNLNMEHDAKWREICADCLNRELVNREVAQRCVATIDWGNGKDFSTNTLDMNIFNSILRDELEYVHQLADKIKGFKFEPRKVSHEPQLPDEVDWYNFFEKWQGKVVGLKEDKGYSRLCSYKTCFPYLVKFDIRELSTYLAQYDSFFSTEYYIGKKRYHAIKFKDRGTFLVSEKRYKGLKTKKGTTV